MMQTVAERYQKPLPVEIVSKLEVSRRQAERLVNEAKYPGEVIKVRSFKVQGVARHVIKAL